MAIVLALDTDLAGRTAALKAVEKHLNLAYDDSQERRHNGNWVRYMDHYQDLQNTLLDLGIGLHVPQVDPKAQPEWIFTDAVLIKRWPIPRLTASLAQWHQLEEAILFYGNAYFIKFTMPHVETRIAELKRELLLRAIPQLREQSHAKDVKGYWDAKEVRQRVDWFDVYAQLVPDLIVVRQDAHQYKAACPFHAQGKVPSTTLSINTERGVYFCFSCQAKGSGFDFVMNLYKLEFAQAVNRVAELGNLQ